MPLWSARLLVFTTSAAVLVLEILAGRLLAPYVGVSLETFTGIIGTVLAGISLGAWSGGRLADRREPRSILGPLLVAGGAAGMLAPTVVDALGPSVRGGGPAAVVLLAAFGFLLPAMLLSAVQPVVVKLRLTQLAETGAVVGSFSAVGTAGAIFGTFGTGFVLLAAFPTRPIVLGLGLVLAVAGGSAMWQSRRWAPMTTVGAAILVTAGPLVFSDGPCLVETTYSCVDIERDAARPDGRILWLDDLRHSYVALDDPSHLEFRYIEVFADVIGSQTGNGPLDVLSIGGGGFTIPRWVSANRPGSRNTVLELDRGLVEVATVQLGLDLRSVERIETGDARMTVLDVPEDRFDVAVGDAFGGLAVPWHLTTRQFVTEVRKRLGPQGIYVLNLIDRPPGRFARAETATLLAVFEHVAVVAPPSYLDGTTGGNFVLVGAKMELDSEALSHAIRRRGGTEIVVTGRDLEDWLGGARELTDDFAPVDQLIGR